MTYTMKLHERSIFYHRILINATNFATVMVNGIAIRDNTKQIRCIASECFGSINDIRVNNESHLSKKPEDIFFGEQYILGDRWRL